MVVLIGVLVTLLVLLSLGVLAGAIAYGYFMYGRLAQSARYDLDATALALKIQATIDQRVSDRIAVVQTPVRAATGASRLAQQPPDPSVIDRGSVDDIHEIERETGRIVGDAAWQKRDDFSQPPMMEI